VELEKIDVKSMADNANKLLAELRQMVKSTDPNARAPIFPQV
jgi:hypothetical protein